VGRGHTATVTLARLISAHKPVAVLADPAIFAGAMLSDDGWSVEWPQGIDFGTAQLRRWADEQMREAMTL
jgi:Protein of unknown function (DUF2442)